MTGPKIVIINESTVVSDAEVEQYVEALQIQIDRDFVPPWGLPAELVALSANDPIPKGAWWIALLDNSDQAGALGYHDVTIEGLPLGKVFAKTDLQYGAKVSVTLSHELLEMLADPHINLCALVEHRTSTSLYAYEVGDPVESDVDGYEIKGVTVSDFVFPAWFEGFWKAGRLNSINADGLPSRFSCGPEDTFRSGISTAAGIGFRKQPTLFRSIRPTKDCPELEAVGNDGRVGVKIGS